MRFVESRPCVLAGRLCGCSRVSFSPICMTHISVDPYAWLKPIYAQLRANPTFARLAPVSQFLELCRAANEYSPRKAEAMRE